MKVVDSSTLAKYLNREPAWEEVSRVLEEGCITLEFSLKEVGNSILKRVRRGEVDRRIAESAYEEFIALRPIRLVGQEGLYQGAFRIAASTGIPLYDALFIQLAKQLKASLVTSDAEQARVCEKVGAEVMYIP